MNITVIGAGAIGGHIAAKLAAAGERVTVVARGRASQGDPRARAQAQGERRRDRRARRGDGSHRRGRRRGPDRARSQGAPTLADRSRGRLDRDALDDAHDDAKRFSVVVLLQAWRTARGGSARERRSRRSDRSPSADRRHRRRHQLPGGGDRKRRASFDTSKATACRSRKSTGKRLGASSRCPSSSREQASNRPCSPTCVPKSG